MSLIKKPLTVIESVENKQIKDGVEKSFERLKKQKSKRVIITILKFLIDFFNPTIFNYTSHKAIENHYIIGEKKQSHEELKKISNYIKKSTIQN